jgi:hypothetical protein
MDSATGLAGRIVVAALIAGRGASAEPFPVSPDVVITTAEFEGFETRLHLHSGEGFHPCLILQNEASELHALLTPSGDWRVGTVVVNKGRLSPIPGVGIGNTLADLKKAVPDGRLIRVESELTDPVVFRARVDRWTVDATVEWEPAFRRQGSDWRIFDVEKIEDSARVLSLAWY